MNNENLAWEPSQCGFDVVRGQGVEILKLFKKFTKNIVLKNLFKIFNSSKKI
jgi:hypothetical protein